MTENISKIIFFNFPGLGIEPRTVHSPGGVGGVVSERLPAVSIITLVEGVDGQLGTREDDLDQDDKLLIHEPSGRLDRQLHTTLLPVHPELSKQKTTRDRCDKIMKAKLLDWTDTTGGKKGNFCFLIMEDGEFSLPEKCHIYYIYLLYTCLFKCLKPWF